MAKFLNFSRPTSSALNTENKLINSGKKHIKMKLFSFFSNIRRDESNNNAKDIVIIKLIRNTDMERQIKK